MQELKKGIGENFLHVLPWVRARTKNNEIFRPCVDAWCPIETWMSSPVGDVLQHVHRKVSNAGFFWGLR